MLSSGIIDLAIGLTFVFGVTAALASMVTELISRFMGLRGAYLLSGLRELVDGGGSSTDLVDVTEDYQRLKELMQHSSVPAAEPPPADPSPAGQPPAEQSPAGQPPPAEQPPPAQPSPAEQPPPAQPSPAGKPSMTAALLGGPILSSQGIAGQFSDRKFTLGQSRGTGRLPKMTAYGTGRPSTMTSGQDAAKPETAKQDAAKPEAAKPEAAKPEPAEPEPASVWGLWSQRRSLPSYISAKSFAEAVIDLLVLDTQGQATMTAIQDNLDKLPAQMPFKTSLEALAKNADNDVSRFRASVAQWFDDHMDRVSGWYKRHVAVITVVVGAILVVLLNLNALTIGRTLYTENAVSTAVSTVASKVESCKATQSQEECLSDLEGQLSAAAAAGLPVGWGTVRDCTEPSAQCNWLDQRGILSRHGDSFWQLVLVLIGFLIMIIAIVPGARFWFGLLSQLGPLRATGPKPDSSAGS